MSDGFDAKENLRKLRNSLFDPLSDEQKALLPEAEKALRQAARVDAMSDQCGFCFGTGRYRGIFGHNDPLCPNCNGTGKTDAIVERLREYARGPAFHGLSEEAADEIERLRKELAEWKQAAGVEARLRREFNDEIERLRDDVAQQADALRAQISDRWQSAGRNSCGFEGRAHAD